MEKTLGIVGQGFVGSAVREGLKTFFQIETYDKAYPAPNLTVANDESRLALKSTCNSIETLCSKARVIFVCVPTPMKVDGSADLSIVTNVINEISRCAKDHIAVIKSTIPPGTTEHLNEVFAKHEHRQNGSKFQIVFNPEFLTEVNAMDDFKNQNRVIIGGPRPASTYIKQIFERAFPKIPIVKTSGTTAEMVKYTINCFLMTKVLFANEMYQLCEALDIDWDKVAEYAKYDERIGNSHLGVPGPDGKFGAGGSCFPKDINALIARGKELGCDMSVLKAVWEKNLLARPERDWEQLKGRAVSDE